MQLFQLSWEPARAAGLSQRPAGSTNSGKHWEQTFLPPVMSSLHPRHRTSKRSPIMQRNPPAFNQPARISTIRPGLPTSSSPHKANQFGMKPPGSYSPIPLILPPIALSQASPEPSPHQSPMPIRQNKRPIAYPSMLFRLTPNTPITTHHTMPLRADTPASPPLTPPLCITASPAAERPASPPRTNLPARF